MAGVLLAALGGALFLRAAMPDLWLQLTQELPQRLAVVSQSDSVAEQPRAEPTVTSAPAAPLGIDSQPPPTLPTRGSDATGETDGLAQETDTDARSQESTAPAEEPSAAATVAGSEPPIAASTRPTAWHAFWKPFRTESSAAGFASHIGAATGLPIEIRRNPHGTYLVGFPYADHRELERNIALIEARTGLRVLAQAHR